MVILLMRRIPLAILLTCIYEQFIHITHITLRPQYIGVGTGGQQGPAPPPPPNNFVVGQNSLWPLHYFVQIDI